MDNVALAIAGIGCTSIVALIIAVLAKAKSDAAVDLARGTSERSEKMMKIVSEHLKDHDNAH